MPKSNLAVASLASKQRSPNLTAKLSRRHVHAVLLAVAIIFGVGWAIAFYYSLSELARLMASAVAESSLG